MIQIYTEIPHTYSKSRLCLAKSPKIFLASGGVFTNQMVLNGARATISPIKAQPLYDALFGSVEKKTISDFQ